MHESMEVLPAINARRTKLALETFSNIENGNTDTKIDLCPGANFLNNRTFMLQNFQRSI